MSDTYSEDDRKPAAVEYREPRNVEKGEGSDGGVKLPPSGTTTQSKRARSSSSRHKGSHKHSHKHKQHHRDKSSRNNRTANDGEDEKIAATDSRRAPFASKASNRRSTELVSLAEDTKPPYKPSKKTRRMEEVDNESIANSICHSGRRRQQCVPPLPPQQMKMLSIATRQEQMQE
jgi:hypothetical protein